MRALFSEPDQFRLSWCHWATATRLLCGLSAISSERGVLVQNAREIQGQFEDRIINWKPGVPDTVLIEADEGLSESEL